MKIVAQVKLMPASAHDADALAATLRACNRAANAASQVAFCTGRMRRNVLQDAVYHRLKADFDLGAQPAVRTVKKVCDAYATLKANLRAGNFGREGSRRRAKVESKAILFREDAAQPFDDRILTWDLDQQTVSIWTVAGRIKGIPFVCSEQARVDQARFVCRSCGIVLHADHGGTSRSSEAENGGGSRNIAHRGEAVWKRGAVKRLSPTAG